MKKIVGTITDGAIDALKRVAQKSKSKALKGGDSVNSIMDGYVSKAEYKGPILKLTWDDEMQVTKISERITEIMVEKEKLLSMSSNPKLTKSQREYYYNLAMVKDANIKSLEQDIKDIKINRIEAQRAEVAKQTVDEAVIQPKKRGRKKKVQETGSAVSDAKPNKLVPLNTYDGLFLELTEFDKEEIGKIREKIALLNIEITKLDSMSSNTKLHKNQRWACSNELERKQAEVKHLLDEIDTIKKERFAIQNKMANGTYLSEFMDKFI